MVIERPTCSLAGQQINITEEMKYNYVLTSITDDTSALLPHIALLFCHFMYLPIYCTEDKIGLCACDVRLYFA